MPLPKDFLWGAATSAHQVEGGNWTSDWWRIERTSGAPLEPSGDAVDHYHRYPEDMQLLADAGLNAYRFSIEWARIEPEKGEYSRAQLQHYRRMIDTAREAGLEPVVTLHHFSNPAWFAAESGWTAPGGVDHFAMYVETVSSILDGVDWVATINEPNILSLMEMMRQASSSGAVASGLTAAQMPIPDEETGLVLVEAHRRAVEILRANTSARVGWTIAQQAFVAGPGSEETFPRISWLWEDLYLQASRGDDFVGTQSYTSQTIDSNGVVPHPDSPDNTLNGWAYRPDALGIALRHAHEVTEGVPLLVTENGIATADDERRIAYTSAALRHLTAAVEDGIDVRGYLHWSALDNFEWGDWGPTFGLIAVDRETFVRQPKPSLAWLGSVARSNGVT
ncbi:glycoside hydrolase family 1 protein [Desertivibrio insolitus]|uniref:glycoside hydrolase family 1 protein n=1 Tax=Herbiconiux sp. SYSU D00978 TaxID=2812562 RepID=UPI001A96A869|nr:family 1 glycosylhydrolase [Herbiconiux sp. SYSU D00978]